MAYLGHYKRFYTYQIQKQNDWRIENYLNQNQSFLKKQPQNGERTFSPYNLQIMNNSYYGTYPNTYPGFFINQDPYYINGFPYQQFPSSFYPNCYNPQPTLQQPSIVKEQNSNQTYSQNNSKQNQKQKIQEKQVPLIKYKEKKKKKIRISKHSKDGSYIPKKQKQTIRTINQRYIWKNIQSNIVNQVYAFLWNQQKSGKYIKDYFKHERGKATIYYQHFKIIRRSTKRYVSKEFLVNLCNYHEGHLAYTKVVKNAKKIQYFPLEQFRACIKYLINLYLVKLCPNAIITSKKMKKQIWLKHLRKCRFVRRFVMLGQEEDECQNQGSQKHCQQENQNFQDESQQYHLKQQQNFSF